MRCLFDINLSDNGVTDVMFASLRAETAATLADGAVALARRCAL
jgi:hypothetical protein